MIDIQGPRTDTRGILRERVLRRALEPADRGHESLSLYTIAKDAGVAYSWAYVVMKRLERSKASRRLYITKPDVAYRYWLKHHTPPLYSDYQVPAPERSVKDATVPYALTTYAADQLVQRFLFPRRYDVYIRRQDALAWHKMLTKQGFVGAGNFRLLLSDEDVIATARKRQGLSVVCLPQLIVDLVTEGGSCVEAARMLFQKMYHAEAPVHWT